MSSKKYSELESAVDLLKKNLMNFAKSPVEPYLDADLLKCQAFIVFSHAEIQVYLEAVARRILQEAEVRWSTTKTADRVITTLMAFRHPEGISVPNNPINPHENGNFEKILVKAIASHRKIIRKNNGIKRTNISQMLLPLGLLPNDFIEAMLIQLDKTGKIRGDMVHKASSVSLKTIRDPFSDEMKDIDNLIEEIGIFDDALEKSRILSKIV